VKGRFYRISFEKNLIINFFEVIFSKGIAMFPLIQIKLQYLPNYEVKKTKFFEVITFNIVNYKILCLHSISSEEKMIKQIAQVLGNFGPFESI